MKLIDITNSHSQLVNEQLANTDAYYIKVYSLGQTTVSYADAATHRDIVILNKKDVIKMLKLICTFMYSIWTQGSRYYYADDNFVEIQVFQWKKATYVRINIDKLKPPTNKFRWWVF